MGTVTAATVIGKVQIILQDVTGIRWPQETELLGWLNDGQREVIIFKPNACVTNKGVQLATGTKQNIPVDGIQLMDVVRNLGTDGNVPGRAIRITMREILDAQNPSWHSSTPSATVKHYTFSPLDPKHFYVYPPQPSTQQGWVELIYTSEPTDLTLLTQAISLDNIYQSVLVDYILYRCYSKDTDYAANPARASASQAAYIGALTGKTQAEVLVNPNTSAPSNPNV